MSENHGRSSGPSPWLVSRRQQREKIAAGTNQVFDRSPPPIEENEAEDQVLIIESDSESDSSSDSSMSEKDAHESSDDVIHIEGTDSHFIRFGISGSDKNYSKFQSRRSY